MPTLLLVQADELVMDSAQHALVHLVQIVSIVSIVCIVCISSTLFIALSMKIVNSSSEICAKDSKKDESDLNAPQSVPLYAPTFACFLPFIG
jgi:hypothetical protein